jgi:hypothetical protein
LRLAAFVLATGCTGTIETAPPVIVSTAGTLQVDWTINGARDPSLCTQSAAAAIQVIVNDASGAFVGTFQQSCAAFATSITLNPGTYTAGAHLVDLAGVQRTTSVDINPFTIQGNDVIVTPIDFPPDSFY